MQLHCGQGKGNCNETAVVLACEKKNASHVLKRCGKVQAFSTTGVSNFKTSSCFTDVALPAR